MDERTKRILKFVAWFVALTVVYWLAFYVLLKYGGRHTRKGLLRDSGLLYPVTTVLALGFGIFFAWRKTWWRAKQSPEKLQEMHEKTIARRERRSQRAKQLIVPYLGILIIMLLVMLVLLLNTDK